MIDKTGGPAFPIDINELERVYTGMTLLDHFAGQALVGMKGSSNEVARWSYEHAEAMLKEREKRK